MICPTLWRAFKSSSVLSKAFFASLTCCRSVRTCYATASVVKLVSDHLDRTAQKDEIEEARARAKISKGSLKARPRSTYLGVDLFV